MTSPKTHICIVCKSEFPDSFKVNDDRPICRRDCRREITGKLGNHIAETKG